MSGASISTVKSEVRVQVDVLPDIICYMMSDEIASAWVDLANFPGAAPEGEHVYR